ncbi:hypothetical protein ACTXT7_013000 [Hymenolepis weldensis]
MDPSDSFAWNEYLEKTGGTPAAWECFKQYGPTGLSIHTFYVIGDTRISLRMIELRLTSSDVPETSRIPPENLFQVDSLLEAVDQRIALNETPPPQPSTSSTPIQHSSNAISTSNTALSIVVESTGSTQSSAPSPSTTSTARRRRFSVIGSGQQQLRRFRSAPFSLARVIETAGPRLRVRLVGTDDRNDCWFLVDSDEIRPYPSNETLQPPFGYVHNHLVWNKTLRKTVKEGKAAPAECFARRSNKSVKKIEEVKILCLKDQISLPFPQIITLKSCIPFKLALIRLTAENLSFYTINTTVNERCITSSNK